MASKDEFYNQLPLIGEHFDPAAIASDIASLRQLIEQVMPADTPICHQQDWIYTSEQYAQDLTVKSKECAKVQSQKRVKSLTISTYLSGS